MSSDEVLDGKLAELLRVMVSRLPSNKTLPTSVVQQLLGAKYGNTYPEAYVASRSTFIDDTVKQLMMEKEKASTAVAENREVSDEEDEEDDESSSSDEENSDEGDSAEDEEEEAASDSDDDEDDDFESDDDDDDDDDDDEEDEEDKPNKKSARVEEVDGILSKAQQASAALSAGVPVAERCKAMVECLRKLRYHVRAPTAEESLEDYLHKLLAVEFQKHGMDPDKYSKADIKRYRIKREVELLQQDGASLSLDRRHRAGRGFNNVAVQKGEGSGGSQASPPPSSASARQTSMFLDDE